MKDITRIHIAKTAYDIEITAKRQLENYIESLEANTADKELMEDVEIRMTELLRENGVIEGGVITEKDVIALRSQLGEPEEFLSEDNIADAVGTETNFRRLYRDMDGALLGGVLSGAAIYFKINPMWTRIAFIALSLVTFGLAALVYGVLWLVVPPAKSAAEKLKLAGRPVTLSSIRELNESSSRYDIEKRARLLKRIATLMLGIFSVLAGLGVVAFAVLFLGFDALHFGSTNVPGYYAVPLIAALVAAILFVALMVLTAAASFAQKFNKQIWVSGIVIIVLGLASFGISVASTYSAYEQDNKVLAENTIDRTVRIPEGFSNVKMLTVDASDYAHVTYVATDGTKTSASQQSFKDTKQAMISIENGSAKLTVYEQPQTRFGYANNVTLYGPKLDKLVVSSGSVTYQTSGQSSLKVEAYNGSSLDLTGSIAGMQVRTGGTAQFSSIDAAISDVKLQVGGQSTVSLGNIGKFAVEAPEVCAAYAKASIDLGNLNSGTYDFNGATLPIASSERPCLSLTYAKDLTTADE